MAEPCKSVTENRNIPEKSLFTGTDNIANDDKDQQCSQKMENPGSSFAVFGKIELIKLSKGFNSLRHGFYVF